MTTETDPVDGVEACRTCGVYYMSTTNYLKPIFQSAVEYPEMMLIRLEFAQWKLEISEHDGLPQYLCHTCIHEFQKLFKFRAICTETQDQLRAFYNLREVNLANLKIKTEMIDPDDEAPECNFIYVDDLSDGEYDTITPFHIPHIPIKEELIEEAKVPRENGTEAAVCIAESASEVVKNSTPAAPATPSMYSQSCVANTECETAAQFSAAPAPVLTPVECELCQHLSPDQEEHKQHLRRVHEIRDMDCHICGKVFKNSTTSRFKFHLKWHNINKHVKCPQCGFVCSSRQALNEHKRAAHSKICCKICGKGVLAKKMKSHLRQHEVLTKFPCEYCTEAFQTDEERESHIWQVHADNDKNTSSTALESMDEQFPPSSSNINDSHMNSEEVVHVELFCAHCEQKFGEQSDLEKHVAEEHLAKQLTVIKQEEKLNHQNIVTAEAIFNRAGENVVDANHEEDDKNTITIFEDYDDDDDDEDNDDEHVTLPQDTSQYSMKQNDDTSTSDFKNSQNFTQYRNNFTKSNFDDDDDDDDDEVTIEHFNPLQQRALNEQEETMDKMETSSPSESESEVEDSFLHEEVIVQLPFACAKCSDKFATIEELRVHYQQHQEQLEKSPTKSKFKCETCSKEFDLKFSLNRHMKRHNKLISSA